MFFIIYEEIFIKPPDSCETLMKGDMFNNDSTPTFLSVATEIEMIERTATTFQLYKINFRKLNLIFQLMWIATLHVQH